MMISQRQIDLIIDAKLSYPDKIVLFLPCGISHLNFSRLHNMSTYDQSEFDEINCLNGDIKNG